ncbi:orotate phosphoribosyltransferase [Brevibacterium sanguinis]|uniref:Orotate phosphoribosyltransferase n=2 Tax=Brevibacterium TaxID=1696 RepID=A0A366IF12_9MICO|nr:MULTISPECIES: orotate phosphoribosyltransferase [Brevibacterium]RBP61512.1 orotate phosphoribosyltransferase [Brevibacterium sanguinis]RBP68606.1 orotate phosphoribosyltransferase [Brevibacterium celere]
MSRPSLKAFGESSGLSIQDPDERHAEVARDLIAVSYRRRSFHTAGGVDSDYHLDPDLFLTKPTVLRRLGSLLALRIPRDVDRVVGSEPGSLPLAVAVSLATGLPYTSARIRRESVTLAGEVHQGEKVVLLEDVLSSGSHARRSVQVLRSAGVEVKAVLGVVDRGEGAGELLSRENVDLVSLYTIAELSTNALIRRFVPAEGDNAEGEL